MGESQYGPAWPAYAPPSAARVASAPSAPASPGLRATSGPGGRPWAGAGAVQGPRTLVQCP